MSAEGSWVEAMAKAEDERTRRSRIVKEVQKNIEFFRQKWSDFCEMVEEYGEHVDGCRNDAACEYRVGEQPLVAQLEAVKTALEEAKRSGTSADFTRLEEQRKELWQTRSGLPLAEPPEKGCKLYNYYDFLYVNIPMDPLFWIRPGQIDPTPWLLRDYAWDLTDTKRLIADSALLSIVHDNHGLSGTDRRVYQHVVYTGKYFKRDCFCSGVLKVLGGQDSLDRIQRAHDRVLPAIKKKREKRAQTEQEEKAKETSSINIQRSNVILGDVQAENVHIGNHASIHKPPKPKNKSKSLITKCLRVLSWLWTELKWILAIFGLK